MADFKGDIKTRVSFISIGTRNVRILVEMRGQSTSYNDVFPIYGISQLSAILASY